MARNGMIALVTVPWIPFMLAAVAGGVGCAARAAVREMSARWGVSAPIAILGVNLLGAGLAGAIAGAAGETLPEARSIALAALSGWTTYSAFSVDVLTAVRAGRVGRAAMLWIGTIIAVPAIAHLASRLVA